MSKMKKFLFISILGVFMTMNVYSQGGRSITVNYKHSARIPFNKIDIALRYENNSYSIFILTKQMEGMTGYEYSNTENVIIITKEYFDNIYERLLSLDFREILLNNEDVIGSDGAIIKIRLGNSQNNIVLNLWSPDYKAFERGTQFANEIVIELFNKAGLKEWL
jgi:hypothetical protein